MAADWIKMRVDLADDPAVIHISSTAGLDPDAVVGKLHRLWSWADRHTTDGTAFGITPAWVDRLVCSQGFAGAMVTAKWLEFTAEGIVFPNFGRHNGASAKQRGDSMLRQRNSRKKRGHKSVTNRSQNGHESVTEKSDRSLLFSSLSLPFSSADFLSAWEGFCEYRARKSGKGWTNRAAEMVLTKLAPWGEAKAIQALNQAVERSWTTVFEPKDNGNGRPNNGHGNPHGGTAVEKASARNQARRAHEFDDGEIPLPIGPTRSVAQRMRTPPDALLGGS